MKIIKEFATGENIPDGAVYLSTKLFPQESGGSVPNYGVAHFFLLDAPLSDPESRT
jgi:hypothetical protein